MESEKYTPVTQEKNKKILDFLTQMSKSKNVRKGVNETTKCINRGTAKLVIIAVDAEPPEITFSLPILCEDKGVPFVHVKSKNALGKSCFVERPVIACCVNVPKDKESLRIEDRVNEILN